MENELRNRFRKLIQKDKKISNAYMLIHSERHGVHLNMAEGSTGDFSAHPEQPYFIASVDKTFTSVLISNLVEQGKLFYEDSISSYLDSELLHNLHNYEGKEYTNEIKIKHLLNHTSGLFGDAVDDAKREESLIDLLLAEPSETWDPHQIVMWSKKHMKTHFPPGKGFHYSDIGYYLLILIIEQITGEPYYESLNKYIFQPLGMKHTYMIGYTEPLNESRYPVADCYIDNSNITQDIRLGMDYAGGRVAATSEDLLIFMKALANYQLLRKDTMETMMGDLAKYFLGIDYGYGIMKFKHVPLFMPKKYGAWGNAGSTGSLMFCHPGLETYFIGSLNSFRYHRKGIMLMFKMIDIMSKYINEEKMEFTR